MPRVTLTDLVIQRLKPSGQQVFYRCNRTPSFGLRLSQAGGKSFFAIIGRKYVHLGKYPAVSLQDARREASRLLDAGYLPAKQSVSAAIQTYLSTHIRSNYRPRSATEAERLLKKHLTPTTPATLLRSRPETSRRYSTTSNLVKPITSLAYSEPSSIGVSAET